VSDAAPTLGPLLRAYARYATALADQLEAAEGGTPDGAPGDAERRRGDAEAELARLVRSFGEGLSVADVDTVLARAAAALPGGSAASEPTDAGGDDGELDALRYGAWQTTQGALAPGAPSRWSADDYQRGEPAPAVTLDVRR
jgi:hypothetical protein